MKYYSIKESIKLLNVSKTSIYRWRNKGQLKIEKINGHSKISADEIKRVKSFFNLNLLNNKNYYSVKDVAEMFDINIYTLYKYGKEHIIEIVKIKDIKMIHKSEFDKLDFYSLREAMAILNLEKNQLFEMKDAGTIKIIKLKKNYIVPARELQTLLKNKGE